MSGVGIIFFAFTATSVASSVLASKQASLNGRTGRYFAVSEVEHRLESSLEILASGKSSALVSSVERSLFSTFQAIPKTGEGKLSPLAVHHLVHAYFAKEHGWSIHGLEGTAFANTSIADATTTQANDEKILAEQVPKLMLAILQAHRKSVDITFLDVVNLVAALEQLIVDQFIDLLETAYAAFGLSYRDKMTEEMLWQVVSAFFIVFESEKLARNPRHLKVLTQSASRGLTGWAPLAEMARDVVGNYLFEHNKFGQCTFTVEDAAQIVKRGILQYSQFRNVECEDTKKALISIDREGSGRVPLMAFYAGSDSTLVEFTETADQLRIAGSLDEVDPRLPEVLVANYMNGASNCKGKNGIFSICCISQCNRLMSSVEESVQAPRASPEQLLHLVENLASSTVDAPRKLPTSLQAKLWEISKKYGGRVPLHSQEFGQWMHLAFPHDCPSTQKMTTKMRATDKSEHATGELVAKGDQTKQGSIMSTSVYLIEHGGVKDSSIESSSSKLEKVKTVRSRSALSNFMKLVMLMALVVVMLRTAAFTWPGNAEDSKGKATKSQSHAL